LDKDNQLYYSKNTRSQVSAFDEPFFPVISKKSQNDGKLVKNGGLSPITIAKRRNRVKGLIDIETIIK
jgi:hypothetical protein